MKFVYWTVTWAFGVAAVLWAMVAGQWLGAALLIPVWLAATIAAAKRLGFTD